MQCPVLGTHSLKRVKRMRRLKKQLCLVLGWEIRKGFSMRISFKLSVERKWGLMEIQTYSRSEKVVATEVGKLGSDPRAAVHLTGLLRNTGCVTAPAPQVLRH